MRILLLVLAFSTLGFNAMAQDGPAQRVATTNTITANVKGMVCDFCARAVEKVFKKETGVTKVDVDLDLGKIIVTLDDDADIDDARVEKLIKDSGYALIDIERPDA